MHDPAEIAVAFDAVSYSKGASIIRMLAEYLGEKKFRDGLRHYLKKHQYGNTETEDLWRALEKVSGKPVAKMMANWTGKAGYPLVSISRQRQHIRTAPDPVLFEPYFGKGDSGFDCLEYSHLDRTRSRQGPPTIRVQYKENYLPEETCFVDKVECE